MRTKVDTASFRPKSLVQLSAQMIRRGQIDEKFMWVPTYRGRVLTSARSSAASKSSLKSICRVKSTIEEGCVMIRVANHVHPVNPAESTEGY